MYNTWAHMLNSSAKISPSSKSKRPQVRSRNFTLECFGPSNVAHSFPSRIPWRRIDIPARCYRKVHLWRSGFPVWLRSQMLEKGRKGSWKQGTVLFLLQISQISKFLAFHFGQKHQEISIVSERHSQLRMSKPQEQREYTQFFGRLYRVPIPLLPTPVSYRWLYPTQMQFLYCIHMYISMYYTK